MQRFMKNCMVGIWNNFRHFFTIRLPWVNLESSTFLMETIESNNSLCIGCVDYLISRRWVLLDKSELGIPWLKSCKRLRYLNLKINFIHFSFFKYWDQEHTFATIDVPDLLRGDNEGCDASLSGDWDKTIRSGSWRTIGEIVLSPCKFLLQYKSCSNLVFCMWSRANEYRYRVIITKCKVEIPWDYFRYVWLDSLNESIEQHYILIRVLNH